MNIIEAHNISYLYPDGTEALKGIDFSVKKGSITAILGPNGAGKSTLLMHHNGTLKPTKGAVYLMGEPFVYDRKGLNRIRSMVGMVFQNPDHQLFAPTVRQDVAFGPKNQKLTAREIKKRVDEALHLVKMEDCADKPPHFLSHGQKKRVAIAGVIAMRPEIMVLDEPTSGLDPQGSAEVIEILDELNATGSTIIFSTHDVDLAAKWADSIHILHEGRIKKHGTPREIFIDHEFISGTGLRLPTIVQTFRELKARGLSGGDQPLNMPAFVESVSRPFNVLRVRCAVAGTDVHAGEKVGLTMKDGMLYTTGTGPDITAFGRVLYDAGRGEDIVLDEVTGTLSQKTGTICIVPIPSVIEGGSRAVNMDSIRAVIRTYNPDKIGAMGSSAKVAVKKAGAITDFEVDVIQSAILSARRGLNVMVFASGGMVDRVILKIEEKNKQGIQQIEYFSKDPSIITVGFKG